MSRPISDEDLAKVRVAPVTPRACEADRDAYLAVKRELAQRTWRHVQHYADAKSTIVEQIVARAAAARLSRSVGHAS